MAKIGCLKPFRGSYNNMKNIILEDGEIAFETTNKRIYIGNGSDSISNLTPYINTGTTDISNIGDGSITGAINTINSKIIDTIHYTINDIVVADTSKVSVVVVDFTKRSGNFYNIHIIIDISSNIESWTQIMTFNPIPSAISSIRILNTSDLNYRLITTSPFYLNGKVIYTNNQSVSAGSYVIQGQQFA